MRIDAHQHFWSLSRAECVWPTPELTPIHRDFAPQDLKPLMEQCGITHSILVQSQEDERDTEWLLGIAAQHAWIAGVVGWVDLSAPDAARRIARLKSGYPKLVGLRPMLQGMAQSDWILRPDVAAGLLALQEHSLCFDALVRAPQLPVIAELARRHPGLSIVIDHAAKPNIAGRRIDGWKDDLARAAQLPNVYCKLSGLATEAGAKWTPADLEPCARHILACFGAQRVMWGSDWPVLNLAANYLGWHRWALGLLGTDEAVANAVFGGTAARFYLSSPACY